MSSGWVLTIYTILDILELQAPPLGLETFLQIRHELAEHQRSPHRHLGGGGRDDPGGGRRRRETRL